MRTLDRYRCWAGARLTTAERDTLAVVRRDQPGEAVRSTDTPRAPHAPAGRGQVIAGTAGLVVAALGYYAPHAVFAASVSQAHALCSGPAGQFAQALSSTAAKDCGQVGNAVAVIAVIALAGAALLARGLVTMRRGTA